VNLEVWTPEAKQAARTLCLEVSAEGGTIATWRLRDTLADEPVAEPGRADAELVMHKNFEFKLPLEWVAPEFLTPAGNGGSAPGSRLRVRFSLWRDRLPIDALPLEGWIELHLLSEPELAAFAFAQ